MLASATHKHRGDEHREVVAARSAWASVLEQARYALAGIIERADGLTAQDRRTLAAELRATVRDV